MTGSTIITQFELQVNDVTELSSSEELAILNRVYRNICNQKPWEWLKKSVSGTMSSDSTSYYITPPADFAYIAENANYTDNSMSDIVGTSSPRVIFIGTSYEPYILINFDTRRQYRNKVGYAYYDVVNNKIRFTGTPVSTTYEFDYIYTPDDLTTGTSPVFPTRFHEIIVFGMSVENDILQLSEKAKSYAPENQMKYNSYMADLSSWNANLRMD